MNLTEMTIAANNISPVITEASSEYPELQKVVDKLVEEFMSQIHEETDKVESEMPYKKQWVLEEIATTLQKKV